MGTYITEYGFVKKTLAEIKTDIEDDFKSVFGEDIDLDPSGSIGQIVGMLSLRDANLWDAMEEIYNSRNVNLATGISLDNIIAENGIQRLPAQPTKVTNVTCYGDDGTIIPQGKKIKQSYNDIEYALDTEITIDSEVCRYIKLKINTVTTGITYSISIDSDNFSYEAVGGDEKIDILTELKTAIDLLWDGVTVLNENDEYLEFIYTSNFEFHILSGDMLIDRVGSVGNFTATTNGVNTVPANTLTVIVTSVSGWTSVNNDSAGTPGRNKETDSEARIRRLKSLQQGNATIESMLEKIQNEVENVTSVSIIENREDIVDGEGRPPHSFECIIAGGLDQDIADKIWEVQPSGIENLGNVSNTVVDSQGYSHVVKFSRAVNKYVWVKVERSLYNEETYPDNGDDLIKSAIVSWSLINISLGKDIINQRINTPVYTVPGILDLNITLAVTDNPEDTPSYSSNNISIASNEIGVFATNRVTIEDL